VGFVALEGVNARLLDVLGRVEVGLADGEVDHRAALRLEALHFGQDRKSGLRPQLPHARGQAVHSGTPSKM